MFILEKPYVSEFLKETLLEMEAAVLDNNTARKMLNHAPENLLDTNDFLARYTSTPNIPLYSNSENAIDWMDTHLLNSPLPKAIRLFKDKSKFRDLVKDLYPDFFYKTVSFTELDNIESGELPFPCVIKPSVGFFSLGVHMVEKREAWQKTVTTIKNEVGTIKSMYPAKVLELDKFIIEQCIEGEEFAVDAYYDNKGNPVIINILGHLFASSDDVSDRCYITSPKIIKENHDDFLELLSKIGQKAKLKNFPIHIELRKDSKGNIGVIEVNPMRFAGWCVTDLAYYAYGINPYKYFMEGIKPEWDRIINGCAGKVFAMIIGDIDSSIDCTKISDVDYKSFKENFSKPLELRKIDYKQYPVFAFIFAEVDENNMEELKRMLHADFTEYLKLEE